MQATLPRPHLHTPKKKAISAVSLVVGIYTSWYILASSEHQLVTAQTPGVEPGETVSTIPKFRPVRISARVPDREAPSAPVLVSPENAALLNTNIFPFTWKESSDNLGVQKYQLYLDGSLLFDNVGPAAGNGNGFSLHTQAGLLLLTPNQGIGDGTHTWKVRALDAAQNWTDSATWTFTVDATAPILVVTNIGEKTVSFSSQDVSTIPIEPLVLAKNEPVLVGQTEAGVVVKLTLTIPGKSPYTAQVNADNSGQFRFTLPILPLKTTVHVQLLAVDNVDNTSVVDKIPLQIVPHVPATPVPPHASPVVELPIIQEIQPAFRQQVEEFFSTSLHLAPGQVQQLEKSWVRPISNSLTGIVAPTIHLAIATMLTGVSVGHFSPLLLAQLRRAAGFTLLPPIPDETWGRVIDTQTGEGVPYAVLELIEVTETGNKSAVAQQIVTDSNGWYPPLFLDPVQTYTLHLSHQLYQLDARLRTLVLSEQNLPKVVHRGSQQLMFNVLVPACNKEESDADSIQTTRLERFVVKTPATLLALFILVLCLLTLWSPSPWNIILLSLYTYAVGRRIAYRYGTRYLPTPKVL